MRIIDTNYGYELWIRITDTNYGTWGFQTTKVGGPRLASTRGMFSSQLVMARDTPNLIQAKPCHFHPRKKPASYLTTQVEGSTGDQIIVKWNYPHFCRFHWIILLLVLLVNIRMVTVMPSMTLSIAISNMSVLINSNIFVAALIL
jgi:hypothetical protein